MVPIFILGVGRSGTSLLQSMFAAHPSVSMLPETGFLRRYCLGGAASIQSGASDISAALDKLWDDDERLQRIPRGRWEAAIRKAVGVVGVRRLMVQVYRELLKSSDPEISFTGDKDPRLVEYVVALEALFPESHVVHIIRDPRDVLLSKMRAQWSRHRHWLFHVLIGRIHLDIGGITALRLFGSRYHVVRYEDLIRSPEDTLSRLAGEIGMSFDASMLSFSDAASRLGRGKTEEWKKETLGPLLVNNSEKWRADLAPRHIRCTEYACSSWMDTYGYSKQYHDVVGAGVFRMLFSVASLLYRSFRWVTMEIWRKRLSV